MTTRCSGGRCEIVGSDKALAAREAQPSVQIPGVGGSAVSANEADEMEEHLRGLGYIESALQ